MLVRAAPFPTTKRRQAPRASLDDGRMMLYTVQHPIGAQMKTVRLNITMEEDLYRRLKAELPPKRISAFINDAVRTRLRPDKKTLDAGYKAARRQRARRELAQDWQNTETEGWPE